MKKLLSMLLVAVMVLGMIPVIAGAEAATPEITTVNMTLSGILDVNFKVNANEADMTGYSVKVTIGDDTTSQVITEPTVEDGLYVYTAKLPAHRIPESIKVELLNGEGTAVQTKDWTVASYLSALTGSEQLTALAAALQNYGTYAAAYAAGAENAAIDGITADALASYKPVITVNSKTLGAVAALYIDDAADLQVKFNSSAWVEGYQLMIDGKAVEVTDNGNGQVVASVEELLPQDWSHMYDIQVVNGEEVLYHCTYSVYSYIRAALRNAKEVAKGLNNLLKAMYAYGEAAKAYNPRFYISSISENVTAEPANGILNYPGTGTTTTYFQASATQAYATNWELTGSVKKADVSQNLFLSFGVRDSNGQAQWFCLYNTHEGISLQPTWNWADSVYKFDGTDVAFNQAASDFYWKHTDNLNFKLVLEGDMLKASFSNDYDELVEAWNIPLTNPTFGGFNDYSTYQLGIYSVDPCAMVISNIDCTTYSVEPPAPEIKPFAIDVDATANATVTADTDAGTIRYEFDSNSEIASADTAVEVSFIASSENGAYARNWEMSGTVTRDDITADAPFLSFGVKNPAGKSQWFCIYEDSVALQRYWNWADTKQTGNSDVTYNQAACSFHWREANHNAATIDYKIVVQDDVFYAYFGNTNCSCGSCGMKLAWKFDLTNSLYGGFEENTAYQLGINIVNNGPMTISDVQVETSGYGFSLGDIAIRDPFILNDNGTYYLYGTQNFGYFNVYSSPDMETWNLVGKCFEGDADFWGNDTTNTEQAYWAPEVYAYNGAYYMLATFTQEGSGNQQATAMLKSDSPTGPFEPWSEAGITPAGHSCLDASLYFDGTTPYLIFAHEFQCSACDDDMGSMGYIQLSDDLKTTVGTYTDWFQASELTNISWWESVTGGSNATVTDAPFVYTDADGQKYLLWATSVDGNYIEVATRFDTLGEDLDIENASFNLYDDNGGHGMIFENAAGEDILVLHAPNSGAPAHPKLFHVTANDGVLSTTEVKEWDWYQSSAAKANAADYAENGEDGATTLFIGDSFFDIAFWDNFYTDLLYKKAIIAGIGGSTAEDWENYLDRDLFLDGIAPKNLVINIGNNDIFNDQLTAAEAQTVMTRLYEKIHAEMPDTLIYVFSVTPRQGGYTNDTTEANCYELNGLMQEWCDQYNWITFVDISGYEMELTDDIHPADAHYNDVFMVELLAAGCEIEEEERLPDSWTVIGAIGGTSWDYDFPMTQQEDGTWLSNQSFTMKAGDAFKCRNNHATLVWTDQVGSGPNAEGKEQDYFVAADGTYYISLDAVNRVITLIPVSEDGTYTITYVDGGTHSNPETYTADTAADIVLSGATREGYIFLGWTIDGVEVTTLEGKTGNITVTAKWIAQAGYGGILGESQTAGENFIKETSAGNYATDGGNYQFEYYLMDTMSDNFELTVTFTPTNSRHLGFVITQDGTNFQFFRLPYASDPYINVHHNWSENDRGWYEAAAACLTNNSPLTLKLTYANGSFKMYTEGGELIKSWTLSGILNNAEGGNAAASFTYDASKPFAVGFGCGTWAEGTFTNVVYTDWNDPCTITYEGLEGASNPNADTYIPADAASFVLQNPGERADYAFAGWEYNGQKITTLDGLKGDITLTATWALTNATYNITYVDGYTHSNPATYKQNSAADITLAPASRDGYVFMGWYIGSDYVTSLAGRAGDLTITGQWIEANYNITESSGAYTVNNSGSAFSYHLVETGLSDTFELEVDMINGSNNGGFMGFIVQQGGNSVSIRMKGIEGDKCFDFYYNCNGGAGGRWHVNNAIPAFPQNTAVRMKLTYAYGIFSIYKQEGSSWTKIQDMPLSYLTSGTGMPGGGQSGSWGSLPSITFDASLPFAVGFGTLNNIGATTSTFQNVTFNPNYSLPKSEGMTYADGVYTDSTSGNNYSYQFMEEASSNFDLQFTMTAANDNTYGGFVVRQGENVVLIRQKPVNQNDYINTVFNWQVNEGSNGNSWKQIVGIPQFASGTPVTMRLTYQSGTFILYTSDGNGGWTQLQEMSLAYLTDPTVGTNAGGSKSVTCEFNASLPFEVGFATDRISDANGAVFTDVIYIVND